MDDVINYNKNSFQIISIEVLAKIIAEPSAWQASAKEGHYRTCQYNDVCTRKAFFMRSTLLHMKVALNLEKFIQSVQSHCSRPNIRKIYRFFVSNIISDNEIEESLREENSVFCS